MDLPRPDLLKRDLAGMGVVYAVVVALLVLALVIGLMPDRSRPIPVETGSELIGGPGTATD